MSGIPLLEQIPEMVKAILAFMSRIDEAKKVIAGLPGPDKIGNTLSVKGGATKQGRFMINIEGDIPKDHVLKILNSIHELNGDIEVVAGK